MKLVAVGSMNPVKLTAVKAAFHQMFPEEVFRFKICDAASGVSNQPMSDAETRQGAVCRTQDTKKQLPIADYWVGLEGGVEDANGVFVAFAWMVVLSRAGRIGVGRTAEFVLPPKIGTLIRQGFELGQADDGVFGRRNSKQKNGAVGILTADAVTRASYYEQAVIMALIPHKNPELYP